MVPIQSRINHRNLEMPRATHENSLLNLQCPLRRVQRKINDIEYHNLVSAIETNVVIQNNVTLNNMYKLAETQARLKPRVQNKSRHSSQSRIAMDIVIVKLSNRMPPIENIFPREW